MVSTSFTTILIVASCLVSSGELQSTSEFYKNLFSNNSTLPEATNDGGTSGDVMVSDDDDLSIRLPTSVTPSHYLVRLQPFINGNLSIEGYVEISLDVKEATQRLILHISDIVTKNETAKVYRMDDPSSEIEITSQEYDHERQFYILNLGEMMQEGVAYVLALSFEGFLNDDLKGFYRSSYKDDDGTTKLLATTQFQATDARKAFPCFDEPAFKAKFSIEMAREEQMNTISNMPLVDSIPVVGQEGWFWDRFNTTLPMSTYLVAFIVSEFGYLEGESTDTYTFRVWARKNALSNGAYAAELGPKVSKFFEDFFDVPFPLPKQDMAAVPDFSAGAMENWGLIIYRESSFLYDPTVAKALDKMRVASIISHEIAHQWFGDLVTPVWWTDLWLNEGFASYMEYIGLRDTEASMNPMDQFVVTDLHSAFALDSLESSHPISVPVEHPDEINALFDSISYSKGASIIRMMSSFLTEESFRKGLSKYLTDYSYSNAEQNDLWKYLSDQSHTDGTLETDITVKDIMDTWTLQMGYPVITVKRNSDGSGTLTQERFLVAQNENPVEDSHDYKWWVPITFTSQTEGAFNDTTPRVWMNPSESTKVIQGLPNANEWFIFNLGQSGYYRVNYEAENWDAIAAQLMTDYSVFPDTNRAQIIDDSLSLAKSGRLSYESSLELLSYLRTEKSYVPIKAAFNNFKFIANMLSFTGGYGLFKNYLLSLIIPLYEEVNFADSLTDSHLEQRKRAEILQWACTLGHQPCVDASVDLFKKWMEDPQNDKIVSPNLKSIVYCTAIKEGGPKEWKFAWDRYESSLSGTEQKELLEAMGCSRDIWILSEYLDRALSPDKGIKKQMVRYIIPAIAQNDIGSFVAWQFLRNRWGNIIDYFGSVSFVLDDIVESVMSPLNTQVQLNEMTSFREEYKGRFSSAARAIDQATERLKNNMAWMKNSYDTITQWLQNNGHQSEV